MKRRRPPSGENGSADSLEGDALWRHVVTSVTPIGKRRRVPSAGAPVPPREAPISAAGRVRRDEAPLAKVPPPRKASDPSPGSTPAPVPGSLDRRKIRRLAKGLDEITARVDLHGMTESEAHVRLGRFVRACVADGHRHVLVVTGKGSASRGNSEDAPWSLGSSSKQPGVLRRNVPRWLREPNLAPYVVSFTTAHARHGGDGALYVHLRRPR